MKLCDNCLEKYNERAIKPTEVGPEMGNQQDPYRSTLDLCETCSRALQTGNLDDFHERYSKNAHIDRGS